MIIVSSWLDQLGIAMGLLHYHWEVIPFMPANFPWNFSLLPVTVMFLHQYKSGIHPLFKALLFGGFSAFVAEPVSQMADLYHPVHWKHTYSFPIYVWLYLLASSIAKKGIDFGKSFQKDSNP
ncbi:CBO0543 family protein [Paenibacillus humicus]|uniref:CBO0543 family protein n=1 Tax=Paenibacillus humicus TaxID=412861 RepID=UPI003D28B041